MHFWVLKRVKWQAPFPSQRLKAGFHACLATESASSGLFRTLVSFYFFQKNREHQRCSCSPRPWKPHLSSEKSQHQAPEWPVGCGWQPSSLALRKVEFMRAGTPCPEQYLIPSPSNPSPLRFLGSPSVKRRGRRHGDSGVALKATPWRHQQWCSHQRH